MSSKGVVLFAHNNKEINYLKLACVSCAMIKKNLGTENITVVSDIDSYEYNLDVLGKDFIEKHIPNLILVQKDYDFKNKNIRSFRDTNHNIQTLSFYNENRSSVYDITPYDETLVIDVDYLVMSDSLNLCWGHENDLMVNYDVQDIQSSRQTGKERLQNYGITMYWATVVYFRKNEFTKQFFDIVTHVKQNYEFYKDLYEFSGMLYRNDYAFSIAAHMMGNFSSEAIPPLPERTMYMSYDWDDIYKVNGINDITLYLELDKQIKNFNLCRWKGLDLHLMNKWALQRHADDLLEIYG